MADKNDDQLMRLLVEKGDFKAFEELLKRHEQALFNYIVKHIGDFHRAQDIFQETFYRIFKHRESFNPEFRFYTWAYRIATNLCIDELRKKERDLEVPLEDIRIYHNPQLTSNPKESNTPSPQPNIEENLFKKELAEKIQALVKALPEKLKSVFILSEYQDFSCPEIATILEIPLGTVKSRLHHSYKQLLRLIEKRGITNDMQ